MKKVLSILFSALFLSTFSSGVAHAEVAEDFTSMKSGNTWIELEEANTDIFGDSKIAAVPKGVLKPEETKIPDAIKKIGGQDAVDQTLYFSYSTGIHSDDGKPALSPLLKMLKEYKPESTTDDPAVPMTDNPMFYGDLSYNDDTTSKDVKISAGDNLSSLKLTLSNMNWLSQPIFSELSGHDMYRSEKNNGTLRFLTDSQLVYTIKFPKGFDISKAMATSDASSDLFTLSTSVSGEVKTGMTLTVTLRRKGAAETFLTEDQFKNELNSLNTISVSVRDIAITKDVVEGKNVVTGSIGGFLEYMNVGGSTYDEVRQNKGLTWTYIHYFAAPQEASGKDSNLAANESQYKIQYTFNVVKPAQSTVTFKDGDKTHATVKVETGKAIDTDALTDESMPKNPTKAGYTFKEWNTKEDGKGTAFMGANIVNSDMTVYAIYTKDPVPTPDPTPNPPAPTPDPTPNPPAPTPDPTPNPPAPTPDPTPNPPAPTPDPTPNPPAPTPAPTPNPPAPTPAPVPNPQTPDSTPNPPTPAPNPAPTPAPVPNPQTPELKPNPQTPAPQQQPEKHIGMIPKTGESVSFAGLLAVIGFSIGGLAILLKRKMMEENK